MNDSLGIVGGVVVAAAIAALFARITALETRLSALSRLAAKVDALLKHSGIRFDPYQDVPPAVADALARGKKIEAVPGGEMSRFARLCRLQERRSQSCCQILSPPSSS